MKYIKFGMATIAAQNINCCCCGKCSKNNDKGQEQQETEEERIKELEEKINNEWKDNFTLNADTIANTNVIVKIDKNNDPIKPPEAKTKKGEVTLNRIIEEYNKKIIKNNKLRLYMCVKFDYKNKSAHTSFIISEEIKVKETLEEYNKSPEEEKEDIKAGKILESFCIKQLMPKKQPEKIYIKKGTLTAPVGTP